MRRLGRLAKKRSLRWSEGVCVIEGPDLVLSALNAKGEFEAIYVDVAQAESPMVLDVLARAKTANIRAYALDSEVFARVSDTATPQPLLASVRLPLSDIGGITLGALVIVVHDVRDPGNAGTLIRSADAAGASGVVFTGNSVDPFNPKTLRASAGAVFHVPVVVAGLEEAIAAFHEKGATVYATVVRGGVSHRDIDFSAPSVVVIGNEADGLDEATVAQCDGTITIVMAGESESLNAGVAGSLIAFEALWQRRGTTSTSPPSSL